MDSKADLSNSNIRRKLTRKGLVQACLIALFLIISVALASVAFERFMIRYSLAQEAQHFWQFRQLDPEFPAPATAFMRGYVTGNESSTSMPREIKGFGLGYHRIPDGSMHTWLYNTERHGERLHLIFDGESLWSLALKFGVLPWIILILLVICFGAWWVYKESAKVLQPVIWLTHRLTHLDPASPMLDAGEMGQIPGDVDWEVDNLISAFSSYSEQIRHLVRREQAFTRDVSHEFRSPLTVIKLASDLLLTAPDIDQYSRKYALRVQGAARVMEELVDAFLILARETESGLNYEPVVVVNAVKSEVKIAQSLKKSQDLRVIVQPEFPLELVTVPKVLSIVLGNLIRNAFVYTNEGSVTISIFKDSVEVADTGIGMTEEKIAKTFKAYPRGNENEIAPRRGSGVGLTIVKRLADRFGWEVTIESEFGVGTTITVKFNQK